jgi:tetratricopeptide (TPR) repeat protein
VRARTIALEAGRIQSDQTEQGGISDVFAIFQRVAQQIAPGGQPVGTSASPSPVNPPVAAFENYIKGLLAETPSTAVNYLNAALKAEPLFDRARLALWDVYAEQDEHAKALAAVASVSGAREVARAHFLTGLSQLSLERYDAAFSTFKALADSRPTAAVWNNLGVVQLRRGGTPQTGLATYYFTKAQEADPTEPDYYFNVGYAYWSERNMTAAVYWLREAVRRNPADGDAHYVLGAALAAGGSPTEAARERELARRLSSSYAEWDRRPTAEQVPKRLERVRSGVELARSSQIEESLTRGGQRDQRELAKFYLDRGRRLYQQERDREAIAELNRAVFLSPYEAEAHLLVGRIHLRAGRASDAIDALKISLWSAETAEAHAVLAAAYAGERETALARAEAERALAIDPAATEARRVLDNLPSR